MTVVGAAVILIVLLTSRSGDRSENEQAGLRPGDKVPNNPNLGGAGNPGVPGQRDLVDAIGGQPPLWKDPRPWPAEADPLKLPARPLLGFTVVAEADPPKTTDPKKTDPAVGATMPADVLKHVKRCTVFVRVNAADGSSGTGSGFFVENNLVVTNAHVIGMLEPGTKSPKKIDVVLFSGEPNENVMNGTVVAVDRRDDLAILRVNSRTPGLSVLPKPLKVTSAAALQETQPLYIFGYPFGKALGSNITVSTTSVSSLRKDATGTLTKVQVNGGMHPGNSGGPVTDAAGNVVGIAVSGIRSTQIHFAIPGDVLQRVLDRRLGRLSLGYPSLEGDQVGVTAEVQLSDPLSRLRSVELTWWLGEKGPPRPAPQTTPQPSDGPRQQVQMRHGSEGAFVNLRLPPLPTGKVYWFQVSAVDSKGVRQASEARPHDLGVPVSRKLLPVTLTHRVGSVPYQLKTRVTITLVGDDSVYGADLEAGLNAITRSINAKEGTAQARFEVSRLMAIRRIQKPGVTQTKEMPTKELMPLGIDYLVDALGQIQQVKVDSGRLPAEVQGRAMAYGDQLVQLLDIVTVPQPDGLRKPSMSKWKGGRMVPALVAGGFERGLIAINYEYQGTTPGTDQPPRAVITLKGTIIRDGLTDLSGHARGVVFLDPGTGRLEEARLTLECTLVSRFEETPAPANCTIEIDLRRAPQAVP